MVFTASYPFPLFPLVSQFIFTAFPAFSLFTISNPYPFNTSNPDLSPLPYSSLFLNTYPLYANFTQKLWAISTQGSTYCQISMRTLSIRLIAKGS
jgi:hypothetical protein